MNKNINNKIDQLKLLAKKPNEENIRIYTSEIINLILKSLNIENDQNHEYTFINGSRADSMYQNIILEYKKYNAFKSKKNIDDALFGRNTNASSGLLNYLKLKASESGLRNNDYNKYLCNFVGVGFDGVTFIFSRYILDEDNNLEFTHYIENDIHQGFKKLTLYLRSLHREVIEHETLSKYFGSDSSLTRDTINFLYCELDNADSNRVLTLYNEWNRIFGVIYGDIETENTAFKNELFELYGFDEKHDVRKSLFILQTYYNIVIKSLVINMLRSIDDPYLNIKNKGESKNEIIEIFEGKSLLSNKISNFFEVYYYEWFLYQDNFDYNQITNIFVTMNLFETTQSILKPESMHDILKEFYENLIPKKLRHLLGEYYTPGWFVDFTLDKIKFDGSLNTRLLDPTCGSGSFLTHAIKQIRLKNYNIDHSQVISQITKNIVGYDINPIAVISAKTNYLFSLGDISQISNEITLPIYMCDSTLVPTVYAKQKKEKDAILVNTVSGEFELPILKNRNETDLYLDILSKNIRYENNSNIFEIELNQNNIILSGKTNLISNNLYQRIQDLHRAGKNGYWATILKNSFAPLYELNNFDYVVGNPPWVSWKNMSDTYRKQTLDIWLSYNIFEKNAYDKITTHDDFAMAVTYVSIDHYLKENGKLAFILPQQFLKSSKGGEGFRKFKITSEDQDVDIHVDEVYDFINVNPFRESAANRASMLIFTKYKQMKYPMKNYNLMNIKEGIKLNKSSYYNDIKEYLSYEKQYASPINDNIKSPWLTCSQEEMKIMKKMLGKSSYTGRKGIEPAGAKGVYLVDIIDQKEDGYIIENLINRSRLKAVKELGVHSGLVETDLIYPLLSGKNISKWGINSHTYIVLPHEIEGKSIYTGMNEEKMYLNYPMTYNWISYFRDVLLETRIRNGKFYNKKTQPFYRLDNVGPYTFAKYYVVWREQSKNMISCVTSTITNQYINKKKVLVDSKVLYCPLDDKNEAYYLSGILNSKCVNDIVTSYTIDIQKGIDILKNINIPKYNYKSEKHNKIVELSILAHYNFVKKIDNSNIEKELDTLVNKIFMEKK